MPRSLTGDTIRSSLCGDCRDTGRLFVGTCLSVCMYCEEESGPVVVIVVRLRVLEGRFMVVVRCCFRLDEEEVSLG